MYFSIHTVAATVWNGCTPSLYQVGASHLCYYLQPMKVTGRLLYPYWILDCMFFCCCLVQGEFVQLQIHRFPFPTLPSKETAGVRSVPTAVLKILLAHQLLQFSFKLTTVVVSSKEQLLCCFWVVFCTQIIRQFLLSRLFVT